MTIQRRKARLAPSFAGLKASSSRSAKMARASSAKRDTHCELTLRRELFKRGLRYRVDVANLPGGPDIVFPTRRLVVFCDGDFWHGRDLEHRLSRLATGHNASYWISKIRRNVERDRANDHVLATEGWLVLRFWETDILRNVNTVANEIERTFFQRVPKR